MRICVIVQGSIHSHGLDSHSYLDEKYQGVKSKLVTINSKNLVNFYDDLLKYFDDLVISTWDDEKGFEGYNFLYNKKIPPIKLGKGGVVTNNGNLQSISSLNGAIYFLEKYGNDCIVVKIRSDIVCNAELLYKAVSRINDERIYPDHQLGLCSINDFIIASKISSFISFFQSSLTDNSQMIGNAHFDYVNNYLIQKFGHLKLLRESLNP